MKKIGLFLFFLIFIILIYVFVINKSRDYILEYNYKNYKITESFNKKFNYYSFIINNDITFVIKNKYKNQRKLIKNITNENNCYSIKVFNSTTEKVCKEDNNYYVLKNNSNNKMIKETNNYTVYSKDYSIYSWNNYGITDLMTEKKYNFLKNESYENKLFYQADKYIIFADYDNSRTFNKFYIFNSVSKKISTFDLDYNISFDSYFLGNIKDIVYLYDKNDETEYEINIAKGKIKVVSDKNGIKFYNLGWDMVDKTKYKYNEEKFVIENVYNYKIINNNLIFNYFNSNTNILIDNNIKHIVYSNNEEVLYIKDSSLLSYNVKTSKIKKIIDYFEWNFNSKNKIFVFD